MFSLFRKEKALASFDVEQKLQHIAFIMDGNGRWAKKRGLPRKAGHVEGALNFRKIIRHCAAVGIKHVTVYAFSTENWDRPSDEVDALMHLFDEYIENAFSKCKEENIRVIFLGDKSRYPSTLREKAERLEEDTKNGILTLNVGLNYGGRSEILHAVNACIAEGISPITAEDLSVHLYTKASPDPDLVIRTGGDQRISNFLLWQSAYAEYFFTNTLWPDLTTKEVDNILLHFAGRNRRYGKIK